MTITKDLLPCPMCGGEAVAENFIIEAAVRCTSCRLTIIRSHGARDERGLPEAIAAWNARRSPVAAEPVAWTVYFRRRGTSTEDRLTVYSREQAEMKVDPVLIRRIEPLFAHPSDAQAAADAAREELAKHFAAMPGREMFGGTIADEIREEFIGQPVAAQSGDDEEGYIYLTPAERRAAQNVLNRNAAARLDAIAVQGKEAP
jgi:hypothetical protein